MAATSTTGIGQGAAVNQKGPSNGRNQYVPLVSPHVVIADRVTLAEGVASVVLPAGLGAASRYIVVATANTETAIGVTKTETSGSLTGLSFAGTGTDVVEFAVITVGIA